MSYVGPSGSLQSSQRPRAPRAPRLVHVETFLGSLRRGVNELPSFATGTTLVVAQLREIVPVRNPITGLEPSGNDFRHTTLHAVGPSTTLAPSFTIRCTGGTASCTSSKRPLYCTSHVTG